MYRDDLRAPGLLMQKKGGSMARDDYPVIVYQILSYLYKQLKEGRPIQEEYLMPDGKLFRINQNYWLYILINLQKDGYIDGLDFIERNYAGEEGIVREVYDLKYCNITPKGIEYLTDNSFIQKAKDFLKDVKNIVPFV